MWGEDHALLVRLLRPARKKADSRFSRKLTPWKSATAEEEMEGGREALGGAPPALEMVCWESWRGRTRAVVIVVVVERRRERRERSVVCMVVVVCVKKVDGLVYSKVVLKMRMCEQC